LRSFTTNACLYFICRGSARHMSAQVGCLVGAETSPALSDRTTSNNFSSFHTLAAFISALSSSPETAFHETPCPPRNQNNQPQLASVSCTPIFLANSRAVSRKRARDWGIGSLNILEPCAYGLRYFLMVS
jgi:hypothetical protein